MPKRGLTLLLLVGSLLVSLVAAELVVRAIEDVPYRPPTPPLRPDSWRALLHRPSEVPGLAYELAPNRTHVAMGFPVRTNSLGMRDAEPLEGVDVVRIAVIGDSVTFGFGVPAEQAYPAQLEALLALSRPDLRFDVLNFGVAGYSSRDEALVLEHKALPLRPRVIVVGYYLNDPQITPVQPLQRAFHDNAWWQYSTLLRLLAMRQYGRDVARYGEGDYHRYLHRHPGKWQSVLDAFAHMARLAREAGVPVLVAIFPATPLEDWDAYPHRDLHQQVAEAARERGMQVVDLLGAFVRHAPAALRLGPRDRHPTPRGHRVAAETIHARLLALLPPAPGEVGS